MSNTPSPITLSFLFPLTSLYPIIMTAHFHSRPLPPSFCLISAHICHLYVCSSATLVHHLFPNSTFDIPLFFYFNSRPRSLLYFPPSHSSIRQMSFHLLFILYFFLFFNLSHLPLRPLRSPQKHN